jgi:hypothetical protein
MKKREKELLRQVIRSEGMRRKSMKSEDMSGEMRG